MKTRIKFMLGLFLTVGLNFPITAHEHHHDKKGTIQSLSKIDDSSKLNVNTATKPKFIGFSTLHPLVVHFPIVLIIIAALLQLIGLFYSKADWEYITLFLLVGGVSGAFLAGSYFHPHTEGLSSSASIVLERHELFASLTLFSSFIALILKITGMFLFKSRKRLFEIITVFFLLFSAVSVSIAGHWGAYLTHVEGVGPEGKFIELE